MLPALFEPRCELVVTRQSFLHLVGWKHGRLELPGGCRKPGGILGESRFGTDAYAFKPLILVQKGPRKTGASVFTHPASRQLLASRSAVRPARGLVHLGHEAFP